MARSSMAALITRVRRLISDVAGGSQVFSDDEIQDALDVYQEGHRYRPLRAEPTYSAGSVEWRDFYADIGDWEADEALADGVYTSVTAATSDRIAGHWTFAASQMQGVFVTGKTYDLYGAAADLLEGWAAKVKLDIDVQIGGIAQADRYYLAQQAGACERLASRYRLRQKIGCGRLVRSDIGRR